MAAIAEPESTIGSPEKRKSLWRRFVARFRKQDSWINIYPTLVKHDPLNSLKILLIATFIAIVTIVFVDISLHHEMPGVFASYPEGGAIFFILTTSVLIGAAIFLYPLLLLHYRQKIFVEEEFERLNFKYKEGLQEFQSRRRDQKPPETNKDETWSSWEKIAGEMSLENPDYQDFAYLHMAYQELLELKLDEIKEMVAYKESTFELSQKDILRKLIYATAEETLEDTTYDLSSYLVPISFCMLAVGFGFICTALIPFFGTNIIRFGGTSINLIWATGGFIGAYIYSFLPLFQRCTRGDMPPRAYLNYGLRVFLGPIVVAVFGNLFLATFSGDMQFPFAVVLGSVPLWLLGKARKAVFEQLGWFSGEEAGSMDVFNVSGITYEYAERLHEEGIMNIQNLAFCDIDELSKRTKLNRKMLFDWKDEAILRLLTGNVEIKDFLKQEKETKTAQKEKPKTENSSEKDTSITDETGQGTEDENKTNKERPDSGDKQETNNKETQCLYEALKKVGISNVSTLSARLSIEKTFISEGEDQTKVLAKDLVKLLGWEEKEEYERFLEKLCRQGKDMLGEMSKPTITAFAVRW